jgi:hypothetical protein
MNVSMVKDVIRGATLELGTLITRYHNVVCVSTRILGEYRDNQTKGNKMDFQHTMA